MLGNVGDKEGETTACFHSWKWEKWWVKVTQRHSWLPAPREWTSVWHGRRQTPRPVLWNGTPRSRVIFVSFPCSECSSDFSAYKVLHKLAPNVPSTSLLPTLSTLFCSIRFFSQAAPGTGLAHPCLTEVPFHWNRLLPFSSLLTLFRSFLRGSILRANSPNHHRWDRKHSGHS